MVRPPFQKLSHICFLCALSSLPLSSPTQLLFRAAKSIFNERVISQRRMYVRSMVKNLLKVSGIWYLPPPTFRAWYAPYCLTTSPLNVSTAGTGFILKSFIREYQGDLDLIIFLKGSQYLGVPMKLYPSPPL